jgi:ubiquinone/menaquinone biosynthesis C-methylase UbiE
MKNERIKNAVKARYSQIAERSQQSCCSSCGCGIGPLAQTEAIGYSGEDLERIPEESVMGLGCGNPTAIAELKPGETVLDLGSGAGIDAFLAADKVGPNGSVIGVDMTEEMIDKAADIAKCNGYTNVEFRLGEIEELPVDDSSVDIVMSNCVINLAPDKAKVFREAYRVLRPGGRLSISDIVADRALSDEMRNDLDAWAGCIAGALEQRQYLRIIKEAGFVDLQVLSSREFYVQDSNNKKMAKLSSITIRAYKLE